MTAPPTAWLTLLAALQGSDAYDELLPRLEHATASRSLGILTDPVHDLTRWAKGIRAASAGDRSGALHHLSRFRLPALSRMAAVDRFDAAVRADEPDPVRGWADELASFADATGRPWAFATVAYGRAITAERRAGGRPVPGGALAARPSRRARWTRLAPSWPTASGCAEPSAASTPDATFGTPWRPSRTPAPKRSRTGRPRSCAHPARPPASATRPRW